MEYFTFIINIEIHNVERITINTSLGAFAAEI